MRDQFSKIKRRYFEAFGDLEEEIDFLRRLAFIFAGTVALLLVILFAVSRKPPVVIRVSDVRGAEVVSDLKENNAPSSYEMISFARRFTARYTGYNSYTVTRDISEAFNMMTTRFQKEAQKKIIDSGLLAKIRDSGIDARIEFKEDKLERDSPDAAVISLVGFREIKKYGTDNFGHRALFRADIVLKKVNRSRNIPEGILVEQYREILMNEFSERKET